MSHQVEIMTALNEILSQCGRFTEQSVSIKQKWGTIQWLWQCNLQHTLGYRLALMVHNNIYSLKQMAEKSNIDEKTLPSLPPNLPPAWMNESGTALLHHYNVETESVYWTNSYTQFGENQNQRRSCLLQTRSGEKRSRQWRDGGLAASVVRL